VAALPPLAVNRGDDPANFSYLGFSRSPKSTGGMSPAPPMYSPSSSNVYSPTSPYVPAQSPYQATSPLMTSPYSTSPLSNRSRSATPPTYSPTSPALNLTSQTILPRALVTRRPPIILPTSPRYGPQSPSFSPTFIRYSPGPYSPASPSLSPTSPRYCLQSPSSSPASTRYPPTSPLFIPESCQILQASCVSCLTIFTLLTR